MVAYISFFFFVKGNTTENWSLPLLTHLTEAYMATPAAMVNTRPNFLEVVLKGEDEMNLEASTSFEVRAVNLAVKMH